ncbi:MAG TPA: hypothetical protein VFT99_21740 [Roseiflexaceae bacterium]|nr:hypothetical protein [Roseiflexaceae bacterium]
MNRLIRLGEVLTAELLTRHDQHIRDFLAMEGIACDSDNLADTELNERMIKELLEELAEQG